MAMQLRNPKPKLGVNGDKFLHQYTKSKGVPKPPGKYKLRKAEGVAKSVSTIPQQEVVPYSQGNPMFQAVKAANDNGNGKDNDEVRYQAWLAHTSPMPGAMTVYLPNGYFTDVLVRTRFIGQHRKRYYNSMKQKRSHSRKEETIRKHHAILRSIRNVKVIRPPTVQEIMVKQYLKYRNNFLAYHEYEAPIRRESVVRDWCAKTGRSPLCLPDRYQRDSFDEDDELPWSYQGDPAFSSFEEEYKEATTGFIDHEVDDCVQRTIRNERAFLSRLAARNWKGGNPNPNDWKDYKQSRVLRKRRSRHVAKEIHALRRIAKAYHPPLISEPELTPNQTGYCQPGKSSIVGNVEEGVLPKVYRWLSVYFNNLRETVKYSGLKFVGNDELKYEHWLEVRTEHEPRRVTSYPNLSVVSKVRQALDGEDPLHSGYVNWQSKMLTEHIVRKVLSGEWQRSKDNRPIDEPFRVYTADGSEYLDMDVTLSKKGVLVPHSYKCKGYSFIR